MAKPKKYVAEEGCYLDIADHRDPDFLDTDFLKGCIGDSTVFSCPNCNGVIHKYEPNRPEFERLKKQVGRPRYSRRKRQAKKNVETWRRKVMESLFLAASLVYPLRPRLFICVECKQVQNLYDLVGKSMFKIEPLPGVAEAVYSKEKVL